MRIAAAVGGAHPAGLMHGAVVAGAVFAIASQESITPARLTIGAVAVLLIYWLTHAYTDALGRGMAGDRRHLARRLLHAGRGELPVALGGLPAVLVFAVAVGVGATPATAVTGSLLTTLVLMAAMGYLAAHAAGITGWRLGAETAVAGCFGAGMIVLNTLLH